MKYICFGLRDEEHQYQNSPNFHTELPFGEQKGELIDHLIESDLKKTVWFASSEDYSQKVCFSESALEKIKKTLSKLITISNSSVHREIFAQVSEEDLNRTLSKRIPKDYQHEPFFENWIMTQPKDLQKIYRQYRKIGPSRIKFLDEEFTQVIPLQKDRLSLFYAQENHQNIT